MTAGFLCISLTFSAVVVCCLKAPTETPQYIEAILSVILNKSIEIMYKWSNLMFLIN